jgi:D-beta-D-heptose 7-phosphate kinase/D-beta-D-heptose 1-phosphate adenosyltransferase
MINIKKIFVNGTFDVLHYGHVELLNYAKSLGDYLLVALDSDRRITEKKGSDRPFNNQRNRIAIMSNLRAVDEVKIFDSDQELIDTVKEYQPDIMIVGSDWQGKTVIGSEYAKEVKFFDRIGDESTTKTIESFLARR